MLSHATAHLCELPARLSVIARRHRAQAAQPAENGGFSLVEHAWHLLDLEREGFQVRIARLRDEREPWLPDFDGDRAAAERRYRQRALEPALRGWARARATTVRWLGQVRDLEWMRSGTQEGVGFVLLAHMPERILAHDREHALELAQLCDELDAGSGRELRAWAESIPVPVTPPCLRPRRDGEADSDAARARGRTAQLALPWPRLVAAIERGVEAGTVSTAAIGRELGVSARTLQRRLAARGLTMHCVVAETRRALAADLLRRGRGVDETARTLGFADGRGLARAFRRWTGTTPSARRAAPLLTARGC